MKLLLDANISWRIVATLKSHFTDCLHVDTIGLIYPIKDADVWQYALLNNCIIFLIIYHKKYQLNKITMAPKKVSTITTFL